jgi:hypothetical protein
MNQDPLPYPPQMRNGGSPPAHLSSSSLSNPTGWLQYKWSQPPPCAPDWVFDVFQKFNPPAYIGCTFCDKDWLQQALCEDQQAAGLLPPKSPGGPILLGARAFTERTFQDWKCTVNALWEDKRHRLQTVAAQCHIDEQAARKQQEAAHCQHLLDEQAANERQEANHCQQLLVERAANKRQEATRHQQLLDKQAANNRQEAARHQWLLDEETACRQCLLDACAAKARLMAAATTIFFWLCPRCLQIRLAQKTARRQQREAALTCLQYKQECCMRMAMADKWQQQVATTREKALANEADEQGCQESADRAVVSAESTLANERHRRKAVEHATALATKALAKEQCHQELADRAAVLAESTLASKHCRREAAERAMASETKALSKERRCRETADHAAVLAKSTLADERCRREAAECATASATKALSKERHCRELADCAALSAESTLINKHHHREAVERATALAELVLAKECHHRESVECVATLAESALIAEQCHHKSAERATGLATKALVEDEYANDDYAKASEYANNNYPEAGKYAKDGYDNGNYAEAGEYTKVEYDEDDEASAPTLPPLAPQWPCFSHPHCPTSYVDAVLSTMGGSSQGTSLTLVLAALPSPAVDG